VRLTSVAAKADLPLASSRTVLDRNVRDDASGVAGLNEQERGAIEPPASLDVQDHHDVTFRR